MKYIECPKCKHSITAFPEDKEIKCYNCGQKYEKGAKDEKKNQKI